MGSSEAIASDFAAGTADPAFVTDTSGLILAWNRAVTSFLGYGEQDATGKYCYSLLGGRDMFGNSYCSPQCPVLCMAGRREPLHQFEVSVKTASGQWAHVQINPLLMRGTEPDPDLLIHILTPVGHSQGGRDAPSDEDFDGLTHREREVLQLLCSGKRTEEIADELFICSTTVRNHVQSVLRKLGVHSRVEAVAAANHLTSV